MSDQPQRLDIQLGQARVRQHAKRQDCGWDYLSPHSRLVRTGRSRAGGGTTSNGNVR